MKLEDSIIGESANLKSDFKGLNAGDYQGHMKIIHKLKRAFAKELEDDELQGRSVNLLLTSKRGHYFSLPAHPSQHITNFNGWFNMIELGNSYTLYKSIDNIYLTDDEQGVAIVYKN